MKKMGVVVTEAPGLQCLAMVHLDLLKFKEKPKEALLKCLTTLLKARPKCTSVAFPALGAGAAKFNSPEHVVNNLKDALGELKKPRELKEVVVVVGSQDMYQRMAVCLGHHQATPTPAPAPYSKPRSAPTGMGGAAAATSTEVPPSNSSSVLVTKMPRSKWADTNTLSVFIFSDDEEKREKVCRKLAEEVESTLGVAARRRQGEDDPQVGCLPKLAGYIARKPDHRMFSANHTDTVITLTGIVRTYRPKIWTDDAIDRPAVAKLNIETQRKKQVERNIRLYNKADWEKLQKSASETAKELDNMKDTASTEELWKHFKTKLNNAVEAYTHKSSHGQIQDNPG
ncbi:hypothetical protein ACOMHN_000827 [Nucella lapillus]